MKKVFIVGHAKSGSTLVATQLERYFSISTFGKEPNFFDYRNGANNLSDFKEKDLIRYEKSFNRSSKTLDANPWNIGENSAKLIHQYFPDSHIIICQRDPVKRLFSQYEHYLRILELNGKNAISLTELLSDEVLMKTKLIDKQNYDLSGGVLSTYPPMPIELLRASNTSETFQIYSKYFSKEKIYVFDLDEQKNEDDISKELSIFLDESISFKKELVNSASDAPSSFIRRLYAKYDFFDIKSKAPLWVKHRLKQVVSKIFPQKRYVPNEAELDLVHQKIKQFNIKKISKMEQNN